MIRVAVPGGIDARTNAQPDRVARSRVITGVGENSSGVRG
ncbi:putative protein without homology [Propionibacterium freudenreichii subsp. shermanii]|nr:putative protein without homology [Propionibacterium freudenreichii subsp. shermanii]